MDQGTANLILSLLTGGLVAITGFYAWQTRKMVEEMRFTRESQAQAVEEMRRAREAEIRPVLVPYTEVLDPRQPQVHFGIKNVGKGPALSVDVIIRWVEVRRFRLRCPVIEPGEVRLVKVSLEHDIHPDVINPEDHDEDTRTLYLTGCCEDVSGVVHPIDARAPLFDKWQHDVPEELAKLTLRDALDAMESERAVERGEAETEPGNPKVKP